PESQDRGTGEREIRSRFLRVSASLGRVRVPALALFRVAASRILSPPVIKTGGPRSGRGDASRTGVRGGVMSSTLTAAEKVKRFPITPGVYLMKDAQGRVLYVGKAKNLRNRAGHYFTQAAAEDRRTADLVKLIADIDYLPAETEVDA